VKIIDLHCDTITKIQAGANLLTGKNCGHISITGMKTANVGLQLFACFVSSVLPIGRAWKEADELVRFAHETCDEFSDHLLKIETSKQLSETLDSDKIGIMIAVENGHAIENDLLKLEKLHRSGVRYMTLTHSANLDWAASSGAENCEFEGLTDFGKKVVTAMNEMGMIVDVSHVHETTFWDAIKQSRKPIIASHSNCAAICPIKRNLTDDQIKAIADTGGMIGINFFPGFLDKNYYSNLITRCGDLFQSFDEIEKEYMDDPEKKEKGMQQYHVELVTRMKNDNVGITKIVDHIQHIIDLVGADYVGFGSDFDGVPALPTGLQGCEGFNNILKLLRQKQFDNEIIEKIVYRNFVRVLSANE